MGFSPFSAMQVAYGRPQSAWKRLSALERSALARLFGIGHVTLIPAVRSLSGSVIVVLEEVRCYLRSHVHGCTLANALLSISLEQAHRESCMLFTCCCWSLLQERFTACLVRCQPMDNCSNHQSSDDAEEKIRRHSDINDRTCRKRTYIQDWHRTLTLKTLS